MKRLLQFGFLMGLVGTLVAAYFTPWFEYTRYRSATSVVANGGRVEQFVVRIPADRIAPAEARDAVPGASLEHYKLRDSDGNVIGLAARHEISDTEAGTAWLLTVPSRGTIALAGSARRQSVADAIAANGLVNGQTVEQPLSIDTPPARSVAATGEFAGMDFEMTETWIVSGLADDGRLRGTLQLNTIGRQSS